MDIEVTKGGRGAASVAIRGPTQNIQVLTYAFSSFPAFLGKWMFKINSIFLVQFRVAHCYFYRFPIN